MPIDLLVHIYRRQLYTQRPAAALLQAVTAYCWYTHRQQERTWAALDGQPSLVILLSDTTVTFSGACHFVVRDAFFCNGALQQTYIHLQPGTRLLIIRFTADGLSRLQARNGTKLLTAAKEVWEALPVAALRQLRNKREQARLLDHFLEEQLQKDVMGNYLLQAAVQQVYAAKGNISVAALCSINRVNYKWLERNFRQQLGITPKLYIDNIRFLHAYLDMALEQQSLTGIALNNGYYDQNHFIKACKRYTGCIPSTIR
ncbi:helix-turn-helix transcriptional regulator [Chitinophaga vietnamensis]|uniref:helix-turn-helix transcriptional regulator n=1 Tax=Chitinophaga vietnamensis TaxID=2593957 RepID=UPI0011779B0A|nr:helix-turn-helix transcriptional regulator [Chitinophaga vietnamensis]